jgi:transcription elongation factor
MRIAWSSASSSGAARRSVGSKVRRSLSFGFNSHSRRSTDSHASAWSTAADGDSDEDHEEDYVEENVSRYQDHLFKFGEFEEVRTLDP